MLMQLWSKSPKHSCSNIHQFQTAFFCLYCQVETVCGGNWRQTSNCRVPHQQKVKIRTLLLPLLAIGSDTFVSHLHPKAAAAYMIIITRCHISSAWLKGSADSTVSRLDQKISMLTGLNVQHPYGEYLQVVNYGIGGHYEPHFDHATSPSSPVFKLETGNRVATFMIYVSQRAARRFCSLLLFKSHN